MSGTSPKPGFIAILVQNQETLEQFLEKGHEALQKAWEQNHAKEGNNRNHWDQEEEELIEELLEFRNRRFLREGTPTDNQRLFGSGLSEIEIFLGDEDWFPKEERGKPQEVKEKISKIIILAYEKDKIKETSSNGQIVRLVQRVFQKQRKEVPHIDTITRYVRLWKVKQKPRHALSPEEWSFFVKFDQSGVKNSLLKLLLKPVHDDWIATRALEIFPDGRKQLNRWSSVQVKKLKKEIEKVIDGFKGSEGEKRKQMERLFFKLFQNDIGNKKVLSLFQNVLRNSS